MRSAGLTFHSHLRHWGRLTAGSASVDLRATPGDDLLAIPGEVQRSVLVPVSDESARRADISAIGQEQFAFPRPAPRALLAAGNPPASHDQPPAVPRRLIGELAPDLAP